MVGEAVSIQASKVDGPRFRTDFQMFITVKVPGFGCAGNRELLTVQDKALLPFSRAK